MEFVMVQEMCYGVLRKAVRWRIPAEVVITIATGCLFAGSAVHNIGDPKFVTDKYCLINNLQKTGEDKIDFTDNVCNSSIVLPYEPDDLKPTLHGTSYLHVISGLGLVITGVLSLVGLWRKDVRLIIPWLVACLLWIVSLVITAAMLYQYRFQDYVYILLVALVIQVLFLLDVGYYSWQIRRQGTYDFKAVPKQNFGDASGIDSGNVIALAV